MRREDATNASRVLKHMRDNDVPPDETTATLEVRALLVQGELDAALGVLRAAEAKVGAVEDSSVVEVLPQECDGTLCAVCLHSWQVKIIHKVDQLLRRGWAEDFA